jgi:hypothetical protein
MLMVTTATAAPSWSVVTNKVPGIFDVGGPRADGWLVVHGAGKLYLVDPLGAVTPYAQGPGGYADDRGAEAYLAVSPGLAGAGCQFAAGDVYVLRLHAPIGITKVDQQGHAALFAQVPGVAGLNGIAFDTVGSFGNRLLVTSGVSGKTVLNAIDCNGAVQAITKTAPRLEGGFEVAPQAFGALGGMLVAPDEIGGNIVAIAADGTSQVVIASGLPTGADVGVESVGFIPAGMANGGDVYYTDRLTPGNPHPGTDSLLQMSSNDIFAAGAAPGDMLVATEGAARLMWVHCAATCTKGVVVGAENRAHGEGHFAFRYNAPTASPNPPSIPTPTPKAKPAGTPSSIPTAAVIAAVIVALVVIAVGGLLVLRAGNLRGRG